MVTTAVLPEAAPEQERRLLARAVAGRYRVLERISRGGMAVIYRGYEAALERHVALKLLAPERAKDADERGRFRREGRILAALRHPGIVPVLAGGESAEAVWIALPYFAGGTLAARLEGRRRLPAEATRAVLTALAEALGHAHANGVVHRDVKAENVMFDGAGRPVIADFGVAILATSEHSRADIGKGYGTPEYMAPEQFLGAFECDGRQDLYALGVLGFRMLSGRFPFEGSMEQIAAAHVTRDVPSVTAYAADVPEALGAAIDGCLARDPARRWKDCAAFAAALVSARPRAGWFRLRRPR